MQLFEGRRGRPREARDQLFHTAQFEELGQKGRAEARIVRNDRQFARAVLDQAFKKLLRLTDYAETAQQHDGTIFHAGKRVGDCLHEFVDHGARFRHVSAPVTREQKCDRRHVALLRLGNHDCAA